MASTINATTNGIVNIGDSVATLALQTGGTTAVAIDTAQIVSLSKSLALLGSTSGSVTIAAPAVAGSTTITLPATSGTLLQSGTAVTVAQGGTGQTSYTDGQLLIGNSTGNTLTKATLTAGTNVTITNSAGGITIAAAGGGGSPGGSNTQVQFNNSSAFGGSANFVWDGTYVGVGTSSPSTYGDSTPGAVTYNSTAGGRSGVSLGSNSTAADDILGAVNFFSSNTSNSNYRMAKVLGMRGADANSSYLRFDTANSGNPAESLRLNGVGTVILKGGSTSATGVGIAFPATQSASTDVNTLDDYEEGTWSPTFTAQSGTITTITMSNGVYTKIGSVVTCSGLINVTAAGTGSGSLFVTLPVTAGNNAYCGVAFEQAAAGIGAFIYPNSTSGFSMKTYNNQTVITSGYQIAMSMTYRSA